MNEQYIIAYAIIGRIAKRLGLFPDQITNPRFYRIMRAYERAICVHEIRGKTRLTQTQVAHIFKITNHATVWYYENEYYDKKQIDLRFKKMVRLVA